MPPGNLPDAMNVGHYPVVYLADMERELNWLNDVWLGSGDPLMRLPQQATTRRLIVEIEAFLAD